MIAQVKLHYRVRQKLRAKLRGATPVRVAKRARILLSLHEGYSIIQTAERVGCGTATAKRIRRQYLDEGWEKAIGDGPRPGRPRRLTDCEEQELIALACTDPPDGFARWTTRLLAKHFRKDISQATVQRILKEDGLKPWREKNVVHPNDR